MLDRVSVSVETGFPKYPVVWVTYEGTDVAHRFKDEYLKNIVWDAVVDAKDDKDIYDFVSLVFTGVNNAIKRRYHGQEIMLYTVEATNGDETRSIEILQ